MNSKRIYILFLAVMFGLSCQKEAPASSSSSPNTPSINMGGTIKYVGFDSINAIDSVVGIPMLLKKIDT